MSFTSKLALNRMEIEEVGQNPERLAAAIHAQLALKSGPVPIYDIATLLDIDEIREERLDNFEGVLLTTPERSFGKILINSRSHKARRRFSVAHELAHFLISSHKQISGDGFICSQSQMKIFGKGKSQNERQEIEANRFAISVLAPEHLMRPFLKRDPEVEQIQQCAIELELSKAAVARRFVELHHEATAVVFACSGRVEYAIANREFPRLNIRKDDALPIHLLGLSAGKITDMESADPSDWLTAPARRDLWAQTLVQQEGYSMTLLSMSDTDDDGAETDDQLPPFRRNR